MKIKMNNLIITNYNSNDKRKYRFEKVIADDPLINQYVSNSIGTYIKESENSNEIGIGPAFIVADGRNLVGLFRLAFMDCNGVLNLHYAVHPDYRKQHYGTKILTEVPTYLFKNNNDIKQIELYIREVNIGSRMCAEHANFKLDREYCYHACMDKTLIYSKTR